MIYRLIVLTGPLKGQRITIDPEPMVIGRQEECDIQLPDNEVALHHAQLEHRGAELFIRDLGSMNKVILNKREVQETRLKHGDILELGRTRLLVQAIVQAEVQELPSNPSNHRPKQKKKLALAAAILVLVGGVWAMRTTDPELNPDGVAIEPEPITDIQPLTLAMTNETLPAIPEEIEDLVLNKASPETTPPLDNELRQIREDLSFIQKHLQNLNNSAQPLIADASIPEPAPIAISIDDDIEITMTAVRNAIGAGELSQADLMLEHMQLEHPDYLPAYQLRAELFETWGLHAKARDQWTAILQRTTESDLYRKAVVERIRLGRSDSQRQVNAHDAVRIQSIDQIRFQETSEYDEMRMVKILLAYDRSLGPIDPEGIRLMIYFFEQDLDTYRIELSKLQPFIESKLSDRHNESGDQFSLSVSYVVPKGYYEQDHNTSRQRYFGFIARLHYFDQLVDEQARPPKLLEPAILEAAGLAVHTARNSAEAQLNPASN